MIRVSDGIFFFFCSNIPKKLLTLKQQKVYAAILQDTTKDSREKKLEKVFWSSILTKSKFERGGGGLSYHQVKLMQFSMKFSTCNFNSTC